MSSSQTVDLKGKMEKPRYAVRWSKQADHLASAFGKFFETEFLIDLHIICQMPNQTYVMKVHKLVMAANSQYFREHLQKDNVIDRVVVNSVSWPVLKAIVEFMYCGEADIANENIVEFIATVKFFKIYGIENIDVNRIAIIPEKNRSWPTIQPPEFLVKDYKLKNVSSNLHFNYKNNKQNKSEKLAQIVLEKEEAASRLALELLKKQEPVFDIDTSCTEATLEITPQNNNASVAEQIPPLNLKIEDNNNEMIEHGSSAIIYAQVPVVPANTYNVVYNDYNVDEHNIQKPTVLYNYEADDDNNKSVINYSELNARELHKYSTQMITTLENIHSTDEQYAALEEQSDTMDLTKNEHFSTLSNSSIIKISSESDSCSSIQSDYENTSDIIMVDSEHKYHALDEPTSEYSENLDPNKNSFAGKIQSQYQFVKKKRGRPNKRKIHDVEMHEHFQQIDNTLPTTDKTDEQLEIWKHSSQSK